MGHRPFSDLVAYSRSPYPALAIPRGEFAGISSEFKFGYNDSVGTSFETVWTPGGLITYQGSAQQIKLSSGHANDDDGSTGAHTIQVYGVNSDWAFQNEIVALNGQTAVLTNEYYNRIFRMIVRSAGSALANVGVVYAGLGSLTTGVPDTICAVVDSADNQTLMAAYTIPNSHRGYLTDVFATTQRDANNSVTVKVFRRPFGEVFQIKDKFTLFRNSIDLAHQVPIEIPAKTDIEIRAKSSAGTPEVSAGFSIILIEEDGN